MPLPTTYKCELGVTVRQVPRQYMHGGEQDVLLALVASVKPATMIEIGVNEGLTAQAVLRHITTIREYVGIDVGDDYRFEIPWQQRERPREPGKLVKSDPRFHLKLRGDEMPKAADVVFVDGDHGQHAVLADSIWATELVNPGGMIIWHDYGNPSVEVTEVLDQLHEEGRTISHVDGTWLAFERR